MNNIELEAVIERASNDLYANGPQRTGLFLPTDQQSSLADPRSVIVSDLDGNQTLLFVPIEVNSEANQGFFDGHESYYFKSSDVNTEKGYPELISRLATLSVGSLIMIERILDDNTQNELLLSFTETAGREMDVFEGVYDSLNDSLAAVVHFFSELKYDISVDQTFTTMGDAHEYMSDNGLWEYHRRKGVEYADGKRMTSSLAEDLWNVYDTTFDILVSNHPSAQKQSKEDFIKQCFLPEFNVTYATDDSAEVCSALFVIDDVSHCYWLNPQYFHSINPCGRTVFSPGISTRIDKAGMSFSPIIIDAMADITSYVPEITGFATQCTNRSADYVPEIARKATENSARLDFIKTATYEYPVYRLR